MALLIVIGAFILAIIAWIIWSIVACIIFIATALLPCGIWEYFMYLTFNNLINSAAKLPYVGGLLGFVLTLPFSGISAMISIWTYLQIYLMWYLTFRGFEDNVANRFIGEYVELLEDGYPTFFLARFYHKYFQWLWGGACFQYSYFPWQNGCGNGWRAGDFWCPTCEMDLLFVFIKLFLLAIPFTLMLTLPLLPIIWSITRPFVGAFARLPAASRNGCGKDV